MESKLESIAEEPHVTEEYTCLIELAKGSKDGILDSLQLINTLNTEQVIHALIVLPLEVARLGNSLESSRLCQESYRAFYDYHLKCKEESKRLVLSKEEVHAELAK